MGFSYNVEISIHFIKVTYMYFVSVNFMWHWITVTTIEEQAKYKSVYQRKRSLEIWNTPKYFTFFKQKTWAWQRKGYPRPKKRAKLHFKWLQLHYNYIIFLDILKHTFWLKALIMLHLCVRLIIWLPFINKTIFNKFPLPL